MHKRFVFFDQLLVVSPTEHSATDITHSAGFRQPALSEVSTNRLGRAERGRLDRAVLVGTLEHRREQAD